MGGQKHKCEAKGLVTSGSERLINLNHNEPENVPTSPGRQALYIRGVRDFFPSSPPTPTPTFAKLLRNATEVRPGSCYQNTCTYARDVTAALLF